MTLEARTIAVLKKRCGPEIVHVLDNIEEALRKTGFSERTFYLLLEYFARPPRGRKEPF